MPEETPVEPLPLLNIGDRVKIRHFAGNIGRVVEYRGPLGPGGALVYRVQIQRKPCRAYIKVRRDQLEVVPASDLPARVRRSKGVPETS